MRRLFLVVMLCPLSAFGAHPKPSCVSVEEAAKSKSKDVCVEAHIYDVVELADGTRIMDVCGPVTPPGNCPLTIVSLREDREQVGELRRYRNTDVRIRGVVERIHGRGGMLLSHERQFRGGPPRFRANAKLLHGFSGDQSRDPLRDPSLGAHGRRR